jgi:hypothetical protein
MAKGSTTLQFLFIHEGWRMYFSISTGSEWKGSFDWANFGGLRHANHFLFASKIFNVDIGVSYPASTSRQI